LKRAAADRRAHASAFTARRREVERCLARWDLLARPRLLERAGEVEPLADGFGRRLGGALAELGPAFSAFGVYLASRIDILAASDCLDLAATAGRPMPLPLAAVRERIAVELGRAAAARFADLEPEPCEATLVTQGHRGVLADGTAVVVRLARPDARDLFVAPGEAGLEAADLFDLSAFGLDVDLDLLPAVAEPFAAHPWAARAVTVAADDFRADQRRRLDFAADAADLDLLAAESAIFGLAAAPVVRRDLSTERLLTVEDPGGLPLPAAVLSAEAAAGGWGADAGAIAPQFARALCLFWLHQALLGRLVPVDLPEGGILALPDGRLALLWGLCTRPPGAAQAAAREFLIAAAARDPDAAGAALLRGMRPEPGATSEDQLRLHWRQIVPFRDGSWSAGGESLAEHLFVYARIARSCGYRPLPPLLAFYRGLFAASAAARRLAPESDALLAALQEVRVMASLTQVRQALDPRAWSEPWERTAALLAELPQRLDALLAAAEGGSGSAPAAAPAPRRAAAAAYRRAAGQALALAAVALVVQYLADQGVLGGWARGLAAVVFLLAGGVLLRAASRA